MKKPELSPLAKQRKAMIELMFHHGYVDVRYLPTGKLIGVRRMMYTFGLFVDLRESGYGHRYCYEHARDAQFAACTWDGEGDPPGPWLKLKGILGEPDRLGPGLLARGEVQEGSELEETQKNAVYTWHVGYSLEQDSTK